MPLRSLISLRSRVLSGVVAPACSHVDMHARPPPTVMTTVNQTFLERRDSPSRGKESFVVGAGEFQRFFVVGDAKTGGPRIGGASGGIPTV